MMRKRGACMAVILAACVASAAAGAPSEEWVERLRLLEARLEQSEQREAALHKRVEQSEQGEAALHKRVAILEGEVQRLRPSSEDAEATAPKVRTGKAAVGSMGEPQAVGRRLDHDQPSYPPPSPPLASPPPTCCRWTADDTCGTVVPPERFEVCTHMHEYLEGKTTTHEFADLDTCLGPDASKWSAKFDGASSDVTLSYDAAVMTTLKTPLKVTHAADCSNVPPTLNVQMDTVLAHTLTLAEPGHVAIDVAARLRELGPYQDPNAWTLSSGQAWFLASLFWVMPTIQRNADAMDYYATAHTNRPVSYMMGLRPPDHNMGHTHYCLTPTQGQCDWADSFVFWVKNHGYDLMSIRTNCPPAYEGNGYSSGAIFHGSDVEAGAGTTAPPDDTLFSLHPADNDFYIMELSADRTQITFHSNRADTGPNGAPFRTCAVPAGVQFYGQLMQYAPGQNNALPWIKYA